MPNRQDNARVTVSVGGKDLGVFEDRTGGGTDSANTMYPRGGLGPREALGGRQEPDAVVVKTLLDDKARGWLKEVRALAGKADMIVKEQPINDEGEALEGLETWTGKLKKVTTSDRQADSAGAELVELEMIVTVVA